MLFLYNLIFNQRNNHERDYVKSIYFFIITFFLLGSYNLIFFNEEIIICISLILYFTGLLFILRKLILIYFFFGSELLYLLFFLLVLINIIYIKITIKFLNFRYTNIIYYNKLRFVLLSTMLIKNYYILLTYYKSIFLYFTNLLNSKNKINYLDILEDTESAVKNDTILMSSLYFNYMSFFSISLKNNNYNYVS
jgi:hypothetical protein